MSFSKQSKSLWRSRESWFWVSLCLFWKCYSLVNPSNLQLDLVFPQKDAVYQPFKVFPIVFIIHNVNIAWPYRPHMKWQLYSGDSDVKEVDDDARLLDQGEFPNEDHRSIWIDRGFWDEKPNNILFINTTTAVFDESKEANGGATALFSFMKKPTNKSFRLLVKLSLDDKLPGGRICRSTSPQIPSSQFVMSSNNEESDIFSISYEVSFNVSNAKSQDQNLGVNGILEKIDCPSSLGAIGIIGSQDDHMMGHPCPVFKSPPPPTKNCVVKIDDYIRREVSKAISKSSKSRQLQIVEQEEEGHKFASGAAVMAAVTGSIFGLLGLVLSLWTIYVGDVILLEIA